MEPPSTEDEYDLLTRRLMKALSNTFIKTTVAFDEGEKDSEARPFEKFEVFFMLPEACSLLDGRDIDSTLVFEMLVFQAVRAIDQRYQQLLPSLPAPVRGIGLHKETSWRFGDEVPEAEAMLGDPENPGDLPACWTVWARFVLPIEQKVYRCKNAPVLLPPRTPDRPGTQWVVTEEGMIREVLIEGEKKPPLHQWKKDEFQKPSFEERYGYEIEEDEEEDWDR